ncbi:MAG: hypothetical protein AAB668_01250 [Patescibacteria group bacterium]
MFGTVVALALGRDATDAAFDVLGVGVYELFSLHEGDAEHHLARAVILEVVPIGELDVLDVVFIE